MAKTIEFSHLSEVTIEFDSSGNATNLRARLSLKDESGNHSGYEFINLPIQELLFSEELAHRVDEDTGFVYNQITEEQVAIHDKFTESMSESIKAIVVRARKETGY